MGNTTANTFVCNNIESVFLSTDSIRNGVSSGDRDKIMDNMSSVCDAARLEPLQRGRTYDGVPTGPTTFRDNRHYLSRIAQASTQEEILTRLVRTGANQVILVEMDIPVERAGRDGGVDVTTIHRTGHVGLLRVYDDPRSPHNTHIYIQTSLSGTPLGDLVYVHIGGTMLGYKDHKIVSATGMVFAPPTTDHGISVKLVFIHDAAGCLGGAQDPETEVYTRPRKRRRLN